MAGIFNIIAKLFGNKYDKDIKQIRPIVEKIHLEHKKIPHLSHDELRNQTKLLKGKINDFVSAERNGMKISLFEGSYENIKITTPEDLLFAEALLQKK